MTSTPTPSSRAGRVKGFTGCNDYDAIYRAGGRMLLVGMPVSH